MIKQIIGPLVDALYWFLLVPPWQRTPLDGGDRGCERRRRRR